MAMSEDQALPDLFDALRRRWAVILVLAVAFTVGATLYAESLPARYSATSVIAFAPRPDVTTASADTVRLVVPKYVSYITSPVTIERTAERIGVQQAKLADAVDASVEAETGNLTITVELATPANAADAANQLAESAVAFSGSDRLLEGEVVAAAVAPHDPSGPPRRLIEVAALVVGLMLGLFVALVMERLRPRLRTWREVTQATGMTAIGRIPNTRILKTKTTEAFVADPAIGVAFRSLRANLERQWEEGTVDIISVTSPTPGEGKTTVASLFAESLARLGGKILLVEGDLRRPRLARMAGLGEAGGLAAVLRGESSLLEEVRPSWAPGLSLLAGVPDAEAGDLLARGLVDVLREARQTFDLIVVDAPPVLATDDARTIALASKGVLLVVAAGSMARPVNEAVIALEALKAPMLGVVVNRLRGGGSNVYY